MSALIGLENLVFAKLTDESTSTYSTITNIAPAIKAKIDPKVSGATLFGDNRAVETASALGEIEVELETTELPLDVLAELLGHDLDETKGVMTYNSSDVAPYVAIGFKAKKANGKYRYVWLLKGRFSEQSDEYQTSEDKPKFQSATIKAVFLPREDGNWKYTADQDVGNVTDTFLATVYKPTV